MSMAEEIRAIVREELKPVLDALREAAPTKASVPVALLTVQQVAEQAGGVSADTVRSWIASKHLRASRAGHRWLVTPADLELFLAGDPADRETIAPEEHLQLVKNRITKTGGPR